MRRTPSIVLSVLLLAGAGIAVARQADAPREPAPTAGTAPPAADAAPDAAADPMPAAAMPDADAQAQARAAEDAAFGAWVDGLAAGLLAREHLAGLVVSVVRDDRVVLARGYGMASFDPPRPADADATMFRIGSISKTFTYTAVMQLVAEGRLSLDDAVNDRLPPGLALPDDGWPEPIRVRHLMTHTAGFEDSALGHLFQRDPARVLSPEQYLQRHRPRRVRPPGVVAVYSNYGIAALGAVVAHVSGLPFVDYVEQRLTGPLGMARATFREPLPAGDPRALDPALAADIATGYQRRGGAFEPAPFEYIAHGAAAGGMSATAADMARWMRMHLNAGVLDGVRVLPEPVALSMREVLFRNAPQAGGIAHGFLTAPLGPQETWGHGGATLYFHSGMLMLPARGIGVFASANTDNARGPVAEFTRLVLERVVAEAPAAAPARIANADLSRYAGVYRSNRRAYSTVEKLFLGLGADATVAAAADGSLRISAGGETTRWLPIAADVFQDAEGPARLQFLPGPDGLPDRYVSGYGIAVMERVSAPDTAALLLALCAAALLVAVGRVWRAFRKPRRGAAPRSGLPMPKALAMLAALAWIAFGAVFGGAVVSMLGEGSSVVFTYPSTLLRAALWLALVAALATALELVALPAVWRGGWRAWPKVRHTGAVLVFAAATAVLWRWHVVGWPG